MDEHFTSAIVVGMSTICWNGVRQLGLLLDVTLKVIDNSAT